MRIALTTHGTRGDVQPFVAVALALMDRGHEVVLGVPPNLVAFVERCGVPAEQLAIDSQEFLESPDGQRWLASGNVREFMARVTAIMVKHQEDLAEAHLRIAKGAELLVSGLLTEDHVSCIAEGTGTPMATLHLAPFRPTGDFPAPLVTVANVPTRTLRRATHRLTERVWWKGYRGAVADLRVNVGAPPTKLPARPRLDAMGAPTIHAMSPTIVPQPADWDRRRWPVVGRITAPQAMRDRLGEKDLPAELDAWLSAGDAPVYLGLGSMPVLDPQATLGMVERVAARLGVRAVIGAGWSRLSESADGDRVRVVGAVNHDALLPRCRAAVHHGGAGTTHAVVAAGLPGVVCSVFADQPFWGARCERLGIGVHLPFKKLSEDALARALERALSPSAGERAAALGARLRAEDDAVPRIVELLEARAAGG